MDVKTALQSVGRAISDSLSPEQLAPIAGQLRPPAEQQLQPEPAELDRRVIVQHRVPRNILDVVKTQFELMQAWLEPVFQASEQNREDIRRLRESLETCLDNYSVFLHDLDEARSRQNKESGHLE